MYKRLGRGGLFGLIVGCMFVSVGLTTPAAYADDSTPNAPVTVTEVDPINILGSAVNARDDSMCRDMSFSFNAVVFVKYVHPDGSLIGYSNNFDFSVLTSNPYPNANDSLGTTWQQTWKSSQNETIFKPFSSSSQAVGPGPVNFSVRRANNANPYGQGNGCMPPTSASSGLVGAYAFRTGNDTASNYANGGNNGSDGLSCLGYTKYSAAFTFTMLGNPKDIPAGATGHWRQDSYIQQPFGENQSQDLNRKYFGIEFKYEISDTPAPTQNYNLTPKVTANPSVAEQGDTATYQYNVTNSATSGPSVNWVTAGIKVNAGTSVAGVENYPSGYQDDPNASSVQDVIGGIIAQLNGSNNASDLNATNSGSGTFPPTVISSDSIMLPQDAKVGDKYCRVLILSSPTVNGPPFRHSDLSCITVGLKPAIQVYGGDVDVGRAFMGDPLNIANNQSSILTGTALKNGKTYGSWGEYAASAPGSIQGFGTQSGLAQGNSSFDAHGWNNLTFANTALTSNQFGYFGPSQGLGMIPDIASVAQSIQASNTTMSPVLGGEPASGEYAYKPTGDVTISQSTIPAGHSIFVYDPSGTITISGNIQYTGDKLSSITDIPQVILIANRIRIDPSVSQVDAWLVAPGTNGIVDTCDISDTITTPLTSSVCNAPLTVNGPIMAHQLWLRRTAENDMTGQDITKTAAEIINLRPDAYLWAANQPGSAERLLTTYTQELSPRF